jgi:hypothetical protein
MFILVPPLAGVFADERPVLYAILRELSLVLTSSDAGPALVGLLLRCSLGGRKQFRGHTAYLSNRKGLERVKGIGSKRPFVRAKV